MRIQFAILFMVVAAVLGTSGDTGSIIGWSNLTEPVSSLYHFTMIAHGYNGEIYGKIDSNYDDLWMYTGGSWYQYQGTAGYYIVFVNTLNQLVLQTDNQNYYTFSKGQITRINYSVLSQINKYVQGPNSLTWICDNYGYVKYANQSQSSFTKWGSIPGCNFAIDNSNTPYALVQGQFKYWDSSMNAWKVILNLPSNYQLATMRDGSIMLWTTDNQLEVFNTYFQQFEPYINATAIGLPNLFNNLGMTSFLSKTNFIFGGGLNTKGAQNFIMIPKFQNNEENSEFLN